MNITSHNDFGPLKLGHTTSNECLQLLGHPVRQTVNREGRKEFVYHQFIVRCDAQTDLVRECTLLPRADATIDGIKVTWDLDFLRRICDRDGSPIETYGFIVCHNLGIAVTGIHDNDESQLAITVFSKGEFDSLLGQSVPYLP